MQPSAYKMVPYVPHLYNAIQLYGGASAIAQTTGTGTVTLQCKRKRTQLMKEAKKVRRESDTNQGKT